MTNLDISFQKFEELQILWSNSKIPETESDTRLQRIDRILTEVLGWKHEDICTEVHNPLGYADYTLAINDIKKVILEAKRDGRKFSLSNRNSIQGYRLAGPAFSHDNVKEGINQAVGYCSSLNVELACVTNGDEWVIFRGTRPGEGVESLSGYGVIFRSLQDINENFSSFYDLLACTNVGKLKYRSIIRSAEGKTLTKPEYARPLLYNNDIKLLPNHGRTTDFNRVLNAFFKRISDDKDDEMLTNCFVTSAESDAAELNLLRISSDLIDSIQSSDLNTASALNEVVSRKEAEFIILIGLKGSGKSTFIERFFSQILDSTIANDCAICKIDLSESVDNPEAVNEHIDSSILKQLENSMFNNPYPTYDELLGLFFGEYQRRAVGPDKYLYENNKTQFKIEFGAWMELQRNENRHDYILRLVKDLVDSKKKLPCIILDNADHFPVAFQEQVFQYARSLFEHSACLVIMPITDQTSWQLSREGSLRSVETTSFYLPVPETKQILERRIKYISDIIKSIAGNKSSEYPLGQSLVFTIQDLGSFVGALNKIFIQSANVSLWIGQLSNYDVRSSLDLSRTLAISPHLPMEILFKAVTADGGDLLPDKYVKQALICQNYDGHMVDTNRFVFNIFGLLDRRTETAFRPGGSPLMGMRILAFLQSYSNGLEADYCHVEDLTHFFQDNGVERDTLYAWIDRLLECALIWNSDPTVIEVGLSTSLRITPRGFLHLQWAATDFEYIDTMAKTTVITDQLTFEQMRQADEPSAAYAEQRKVFAHYLLAEDMKNLPVDWDHESQNKVTSRIQSYI